MHTVCRKTKANAFGNFAFDFMKLKILNQEKMFALIHTRIIPLKVQLMKIWKPEINTSSDQTRDALFRKLWSI